MSRTASDPQFSGEQLGSSSIRPLPVTVLNLEQLRHRCLGNEQLVRQILGKLERTLAAEHERLELAWQQGALAEVAKLAHRIKGTAANVGAHQYEAISLQLEQLTRDAREETMAEVESYLTQLENARHRLCAEISAQLQNSAPSAPETEVPR